MRLLNSTRSLIFAKLTASALSLAWLAVLTRYVPGSDLGTILECLFISSSLVFLTDQGMTPTLVTRQSTEIGHNPSLINHFIIIRAKRALFVTPLLILLLQLLTNASFLSIIAVCFSHIATLMYSTINAGLLGANRRYIETISEPLSRLFALAFGSIVLLGIHGLKNSQTVLLIYAMADLFMLTMVLIMFLSIKTTGNRIEQSKFQINRAYRVQFFLSSGVMNTMGVGENWALSAKSSPPDYAFYALIARVIDLSGLVASYTGYSHLPQLLDSVNENNWHALMARCRRMLVFSLAPTIFLSVLILIAHYKKLTLLGYDIDTQWWSLLLLVASIPAVVVFKYLMTTLQSVNPKETMFVVFFIGSGLTITVIWMYQVFGLSGTFVVLAVANVLRAGLLAGLLRRSLGNSVLS